MRHLSSRLFLLVLLATGLLAGCAAEPKLGPSAPPATEAPLYDHEAGACYVDGSYIVVLTDDAVAGDKRAEMVAQEYGVEPEYRYERALHGFSGRLTPSQLGSLRADSRVSYIEQNQVFMATTTQTAAPWGLDRIDQLALPLNTTYTYSKTGAGVDVYIIDTGIRVTHAEFGGRARFGYDAITSGGTAADGNGHGTHVAGIVGGATYGVAKGAALIAVRVLDNAGAGTTASVIAGVNWVTTNHSPVRPSVANMSLGGGISAALDNAVANSITAGITYCIAAGNESSPAANCSPARVAAAITVGATSSNDSFASYSNYGAAVDLLAPGTGITSAYYTSNSATAILSGTSMATPHVAGACALFLEAYPSSTPTQVTAGLLAAAASGKIALSPSGTANKLLNTVAGSAPTPVPVEPVLSAPADASPAVTVPPTFSWVASAGATSYELHLCGNPAFTSSIVSRTGLTSPSASITGLTAGATYYWRVRGVNGAGAGPWSAVWSVTLQAAGAPGVSTLTSPANGATGVSTSPTLRWSTVTGATSYSLQVSKNANFSPLALNATGITATYAGISGATRGTRYYWRVRASNSKGAGAWSAASSFTTVN
jgi:subtilisin family serine protease